MGRDPQKTARERRMETAAVPPGPSVLPGTGGAQAETETEVVDRAVVRALTPFLVRDDGWLRIVPQDDGLTCYFKWKWTGGPYINHYVMVRYPYTESSEALTRLARKVYSVDCGEQRPVKDHYFKG